MLISQPLGGGSLLSGPASSNENQSAGGAWIRNSRVGWEISIWQIKDGNRELFDPPATPGTPEFMQDQNVSRFVGGSNHLPGLIFHGES